MAKIMKRYNQVPHLTQDTTWERDKNTLNIINNSQEVSPFIFCFQDRVCIYHADKHDTYLNANNYFAL